MAANESLSLAQKARLERVVLSRVSDRRRFIAIGSVGLGLYTLGIFTIACTMCVEIAVLGIFLWAIGSVIAGLASYQFGRGRGRSGDAFFCLCFLIPPIGALVALYTREPPIV